MRSLDKVVALRSSNDYDGHQMSKPKQFSVGQTVYIVGKPGVPFGQSVTVLKEIPGAGFACGVGKTTLLVEPTYLTPKVLDVAA